MELAGGSSGWCSGWCSVSQHRQGNRDGDSESDCSRDSIESAASESRPQTGAGTRSAGSGQLSVQVANRRPPAGSSPSCVTVMCLSDSHGSWVCTRWPGRFSSWTLSQDLYSDQQHQGNRDSDCGSRDSEPQSRVLRAQTDAGTRSAGGQAAPGHTRQLSWHNLKVTALALS